MTCARAGTRLPHVMMRHGAMERSGMLHIRRFKCTQVDRFDLQPHRLNMYTSTAQSPGFDGFV